MHPLAIGWQRGRECEHRGGKAEENYMVSDSCKQRNIFPVISLSPVEIELQFPPANTEDPVALLLACPHFLSCSCWMQLSMPACTAAVSLSLCFPAALPAAQQQMPAPGEAPKQAHFSPLLLPNSMFMGATQEWV